MKLTLSYGIILLFLTGCHTNDVFLQKPSALQLLSRVPRANQFAEELREGNLERECVEETCSKEEVQEIFEDDFKVESFWKLYIEIKLLNFTSNFQSGRSVIQLPAKIMGPVRTPPRQYNVNVSEDLMEPSVKQISMSVT
ncbi:coagulation factor X-like isoform X2 [Mobula birostris]|uniref:coagulation factor X-like isoform X2 n=1 Tax=Mobula birostris TaxID=1983395 RepID=UPI003B288E9B